jgi:hypothetical protein
MLHISTDMPVENSGYDAGAKSKNGKYGKNV